MNRPLSRTWWFPLSFAIVLAAGMYLGYSLAPRAVFDENVILSRFLKSPGGGNPLEETISLIEENYVEEVDLSEKYAAAIEAILAELDPHSYYIPGKELAGVQEEMTGNFEGIGIEFFIVKDTIQVVSPIPGGPSYQLGILSGDKIIKVNDSTVAGIGIRNEDVLKKLKGPKGTKVKVSIQRFGKAELIDYQITRDKIPLYSVDGGFMLNDSIGYIKISRFSETTHREFMTKMASLRSSGMKHLVLDLRQNPGGYLQQAVKISNEFLDAGKDIVYTEGRTIPRYTYKTEQNGSFREGKVAVLLDEGSASASEIVAGAIQDWDRGVVIGRRSFGKGLVQDQYPLTDGSAIRLTIAKYYTPSGRCIQKPYVNGDKEYNADLLSRYEDGELFVEADNAAMAKQDTSVKYYTLNLRRQVYGGGGIAPDIFVPMDTSYFNDFTLQAFSGGLLQEFTYGYYSKNKGVFKPYSDIDSYIKNFQVDGDLYRQFVEYCQQQGVKSVAGSVLPAVKTEMSSRLKAYFARQMFGNEGYMQVIAMRDQIVGKAISAIGKENILKAQ